MPRIEPVRPPYSPDIAERLAAMMPPGVPPILLLGVHVSFFADRAGLSGPQLTSLTHGRPADECWTDERDRLLIESADALHDSAVIGDDLWLRLARVFREEQLLDLLMLCGWYHAVSFAANSAQVSCEDGAPRFADLARPGGS